MMTLYCSILLLMNRFNSCESSSKAWIQVCFMRNDVIGVSNMLRILSCLSYMQEDYSMARKLLEIISSAFKVMDSSMGKAICNAILGDINFKKNVSGQAKNQLKGALNDFKNLGHHFGQVYATKTLVKVHSKMKDMKGANQYHDLLRELGRKRRFDKEKKYLNSKNGRYVRRVRGEAVSLLLETCFQADGLANLGTKELLKKTQPLLYKLKTMFNKLISKRKIVRSEADLEQEK